MHINTLDRAKICSCKNKNLDISDVKVTLGQSYEKIVFTTLEYTNKLK